MARTNAIDVVSRSERVSPLVNPGVFYANAKTRESRPLLPGDWSYTVREERITDRWRGGSQDLTLLFFRSPGCRYSKKGECTMCDYQIAPPVAVEDMIELTREALARRDSYDELFIAPLGSLFDPLEVPPVARRAILELVAEADPRSIATESRVEFLSDSVLQEFRQLLGERPKRINIGLETASSWIASNCLGKSIRPDIVIEKVDLSRSYGIEMAANVFLGGLFLTEAEALHSTIETVNWAIQSGIGLCVLFPSTVKRWTLQHWLWERNLYTPPSLWTLIEAVWMLGPRTGHRLGLSYYSRTITDSITAIPTTCSRCHEEAVRALQRYAMRNDLDQIWEIRQTGCPCRQQWADAMTDEPSEPIQERALRGIRIASSELLGEDWWIAHEEAILECLKDPPTFEPCLV